MKHIFKFSKHIALAVMVFVVLYFSAAFVLSKIVENKNNPSGEEVAIYIKSNGVHTDIVMPVQSSVIDWSQKIKYNHTLGKDSLVKYVAMGWGDKGFYLQTPTWADLKFSVAYKAALGLSSSAIHATFYKEISENQDCIKIMVSKSQYKKLVEFISKSFLIDNSGNFVHIPTEMVYGKNDAFYQAVGSYNLFRTCNSWANNALKASGLKAALWTPFDSGIFYHYRERRN